MRLCDDYDVFIVKLDRRTPVFLKTLRRSGVPVEWRWPHIDHWTSTESTSWNHLERFETTELALLLLGGVPQ